MSKYYNMPWHQVNDFVSEFATSETQQPLKRAFILHLQKVSEAMRMIGKVEDGSCSPGDEDALILNCVTKQEQVQSMLDELKLLTKQAQELTKTLEEKI